MKKPSDFSKFETQLDIQKEDLDTNIENARLYKETRDLFIVKEQYSAKVPGLRTKRTALMKLVDDGKVKGILSYSPDRQARNLKEGGELINFVDEESVSLKYTNFHFEPNALGKIMLGIWFVFSKQYSDKLSEDTLRGLYTRATQGKAIGMYKHGYKFFASGHHMPHPEFFELWKKAFQKKLKGVTDAKIRDWLVNKGYIKQKFHEDGRLKEESKFLGGNMKQIRNDPFYYGILKYKDLEVDLRKEGINDDYKPIITEEEHEKLLLILSNNQTRVSKKRIKEENYYLMPLPQGFIRSSDGYALSFYLWSKPRSRKKLIKLKETNPDATLADIVPKNHLAFRNANKKSKQMGYEVRFHEIEPIILEAFKYI